MRIYGSLLDSVAALNGFFDDNLKVLKITKFLPIMSKLLNFLKANDASTRTFRIIIFISN